MTLPKETDDAGMAAPVRARRRPRKAPEIAGSGLLARWRRGAQAAPLVIVWSDRPAHQERLEPMLQTLGLECVLVDRMSLDFVALAERLAVAVVAATAGDSASPLLYLRTAGLTLPILVLCETADQLWTQDVRSIDPELSAILPHTADELEVLMGALARRSAIAEPRAGAGFWLDPVGLKVGYREKTASLQVREAAVLHCLVRHAGTALSPTRLRTFVWGEAAPLGRDTRRVIAVHVCHLRRKLKKIGLDGVIQTLYDSAHRHDGAYRFDLPAPR